MTKMIKMSLIAAVAVTSMTSVASAQPLEEAIKGVDVSGMLRYRYDDRQLTEKDSSSVTGDEKTSNQWNNYRLDVNTKAKVNDTVTANVTVGFGNTGSGANLADNAEGSAALEVRNANFTFALPVATVIAGKQSIPGPFVDNTVDDISRGTGVVALIPAGPVTIAAGHFVTHSVRDTGIDSDTMDFILSNIGAKAISATTYNAGTVAQQTAYVAAAQTVVQNHIAAGNATELAVLGSAGGVNFDVWYASVTDVLDGYSIGAKASVAGINVDARYSTLDVTDAYNAVLAAGHGLDGKASLTKVVASTKVGAASLRAGIAMTGDKNGMGANRVSIDRDNDAQSDFKLWQVSAGNTPDATAFLIGAGMEVMPSVTVTADYLIASGEEAQVGAPANDVDASELLIGATYAMSKNFSVHARYSIASSEYNDVANATKYEDEMTRGRLELKYTF